MKSWKTTVLGILTILGALIPAGIALLKGQSPDLTALWPAVIAGFGLIFAKDAAVTGGTVAATPEATTRVGQD